VEDCFGTIFPDIRNIEYNKKYSGKVFSVTVRHQPIAVKSHEIDVDQGEWQKCFSCDCYQSCYDFSMAKLSFYTTIKSL